MLASHDRNVALATSVALVDARAQRRHTTKASVGMELFHCTAVHFENVLPPQDGIRNARLRVSEARLLSLQVCQVPAARISEMPIDQSISRHRQLCHTITS